MDRHFDFVQRKIQMIYKDFYPFTWIDNRPDATLETIW